MATSRSSPGTGRDRSSGKTNEPGVRSADDSSPTDLADTGASAHGKVERDAKNAEGGRRDDQSGSGPSAAGHDPGRTG